MSKLLIVRDAMIVQSHWMVAATEDVRQDALAAGECDAYQLCIPGLTESDPPGFYLWEGEISGTTDDEVEYVGTVRKITGDEFLVSWVELSGNDYGDR